MIHSLSLWVSVVCVCTAGALALMMAVDPRRVHKYRLLTSSCDVAHALLPGDHPSPASSASTAASSPHDPAAGISSSTAGQGTAEAGLGSGLGSRGGSGG